MSEEKIIDGILHYRNHARGWSMFTDKMLRGRIAELEQKLKKPNIDITNIKIDSVVKLGCGKIGSVFSIHDEMEDGVRGGLYRARFFIRINGGKGEFYHSYRKDGVSRESSDGDIIEIIEE